MPFLLKIKDPEKKIYIQLIAQGLKVRTLESDCLRLNLSTLFISSTTLNKLAICLNFDFLITKGSLLSLFSSSYDANLNEIIRVKAKFRGNTEEKEEN